MRNTRWLALLIPFIWGLVFLLASFGAGAVNSPKSTLQRFAQTHVRQGTDLNGKKLPIEPIRASSGVFITTTFNG